ncbi:MAG: NUDIX hydrolase [Tepidiformaceae bacterium]
MSRSPRIRPIALAVIRRGEELLLETAFDSVKQEHFARPPGGGIEFGERAEAAVCREIREELGLTLVETKLVAVLENIFVYEGEPGHEVVFIVEGSLAEREAYGQGTLPAQEGGRRYDVAWIDPRQVLADGWQLYPDGFPELLGLRVTSGRP